MGWRCAERHSDGRISLREGWARTQRLGGGGKGGGGKEWKHVGLQLETRNQRPVVKCKIRPKAHSVIGTPHQEGWGAAVVERGQEGVGRKGKFQWKDIHARARDQAQFAPGSLYHDQRLNPFLPRQQPPHCFLSRTPHFQDSRFALEKVGTLRK